MKKSYTKKAWAVVTPRGRVKLDTICYERKSVEFHHQDDDGGKVCAVTVTCEWKERRGTTIPKRLRRAIKRILTEA